MVKMVWKFRISFYLYALIFLNFVNCLFNFETKRSAVLSEVYNGENMRLAAEHQGFSMCDAFRKCDPCPKGTTCVPPIQCPAHVRASPQDLRQYCDLPAGSHGYCCSSGQNHTMSNDNVRSIKTYHDLKSSIIEEARAKFVSQFDNPTPIVHRGHPEFLHNMVFHTWPYDVHSIFEVSSSAVEQILAAQILKDREHISVEDFELDNVDADFRSSPLEEFCRLRISCEGRNDRYRSIDGSCNNPLSQRSLWGAAGQAMERILPPAYEDGIWLPRMHNANGFPLNSAREISRILLPDVNRPHPWGNLLLMQFGQFIAHDVTQASSITLENGDAIQCCTSDGSRILPANVRHFACLPIPISARDEFYRHFNQGCMNFVRLSLSPRTDCKVGYGKQMSKVTHFLDGSPVYGSSSRRLKELRSFRGGKLRMFHDYERDLLPLAKDSSSCANSQSGICFESGDGRTNQIISLVALHTIFAREHNRLAAILVKLNPHYSDEVIFQESRKIVIAEIQHVVYNEWLPLIVGPTTMKRYKLNPLHYGYAMDYDPNVNPAITNEFSGAAFRFGHSVVSGKYHLQHEDGNEDVIDIPDVMFNPHQMSKRTFLDNLIAGLLKQPMQKVDNSISHGLSRYLFRGSLPFGLDLAALNIQRGRDHGLRCYNDYLEVLGRRRIDSFREFNSGIATALSKVYVHPDDIDLWVGGLLEAALPDAIVGPTFAEIIADQFSRFRRGDRYFYEHDPKSNPGHFSPAQLHEIRKVSMARIICDNVDHYTFKSIPPAAFIKSTLKGNNNIRCDSKAIRFMNLEAWRKF